MRVRRASANNFQFTELKCQLNKKILTSFGESKSRRPK